MVDSMQTDVPPGPGRTTGTATDAAEIAPVLADRRYRAVCIGPDVPLDLAST